MRILLVFLSLSLLICFTAEPSFANERQSNSTILPKLMSQNGFKAPRGFKGVAIQVKFNKSRTEVASKRVFDYAGTADDTNWNAASTIKFFAAIGALHRVRSLGFPSTAEVTFHGNRTTKSTVKKLVEEAIIDSNNISYDRLVQLAGFDRLHTKILTSQKGIKHTALMKAYQVGDWTAMGEPVSFRNTPAITLRQGRKKTEIKAATGTADTGCGSSVCTTLRDLGEGMLALMLQEQLSANRSFGLNPVDLRMLRVAMRSERDRGNEFVDNLKKGLRMSGAKLYSKPGYSENWYSSVVYIFMPNRAEAWVVAMAANPDRNALNQAGRIVGQLIANRKLDKAR